MFVSSFNAAFTINALTLHAPENWPNNPLPIQKRQTCALSQPFSNPTASVTDPSSQPINSRNPSEGPATPSITAAVTSSQSLAAVAVLVLQVAFCFPPLTPRQVSHRHRLRLPLQQSRKSLPAPNIQHSADTDLEPCSTPQHSAKASAQGEATFA